LVLVGTGGSGSVGAQAPTASATSASSVLVLRLYYRDRAEYTMLAMEFGLEEAQSPRGYLLLPADQAMLDSLRARPARGGGPGRDAEGHRQPAHLRPQP
ncbi:MAG: hypothetical protein WCD37_21415, partial [Chloroflexia bacterium]